MEGLDLDSNPFYREGSVTLWKGRFRSKAGEGWQQVVVRRCESMCVPESNQLLLIAPALNAVIAHAKNPNPRYLDVMKIRFARKGETCQFDYIMKAPEESIDKSVYLLPDLSPLPASWTGDIMTEYQLTTLISSNPDTHVYLYWGVAATGKRVVVKVHEFSMTMNKDAQNRISDALNVAVVQAKLNHPHCCELLELRFRHNFREGDQHCYVYHVLEALDTDVYHDIMKRKEAHSPYLEKELLNFLHQTSLLLRFCHDNGISHRDLAPDNVFRTGQIYKIGDFGCYFTKRDASQTVSAAGHARYMSPQQRKAHFANDQPYHASKADVYSLGVTLYAMASLDTPGFCRHEDNLDQAVQAAVDQLLYPEEIKRLIQDMLRYDEDERLTMNEVFNRVVARLQTFLLQLIELGSPGIAQIFNSDVLLEHFPSDQLFLPIFVEGSLGKNSFLASLTGNQVSFALDESDSDGVYMWPLPVQLGEIQVLLLKLRRAFHCEESYLLLRRKVKACFMVLSSVWVICEDSRTAVFEALEDFMRDYRQVTAHCRVRISKVYVFVQQSWFSRKQDCQKFSDMFSEDPSLFEVIWNRGLEGSEEERENLAYVAWQLGKEALHGPFHESLRDVRDFRARYVTLMDALIKIASLDLSFSTFLRKLMDLSLSEDEVTSRLQAVKHAADNATLMQTSAVALGLVVSQQVDSETHSTFNESTLEQLSKAYSLNAPIIVLSVLGRYNIDKSTFLNAIIQHCTESRQLSTVFQAGTTANRMSRTNQILSYPLYVQQTQLMLIDLERNERTGTLDQMVAEGIVPISSVFAIIVSNKIEKLKKTERDIIAFVQINMKHGYVAERVLLLCCDQDPDAEINLYFAETVARLNAYCFEGKEVIKVLKKPNFSAVPAESREEFVRMFLSSCACVKRSTHGEIHAKELLNHLSNTFHLEQSTQTDKLKLDTASVCKFMEAKCVELRTAAQGIQSKDNAHLVRYFESAFQLFKISAFYAFVGNSEQSEHLNTRIELERKKLKSELEGMEICYAVIRAYPEDHMQSVIATVLTHLWNSASLNYPSSADKFQAKLAQIQVHFPEGRSKVQSLIEHCSLISQLVQSPPDCKPPSLVAKLNTLYTALTHTPVANPAHDTIKGTRPSSAFETPEVGVTGLAINTAVELLNVDSPNEEAVNQVVVEFLINNPSPHALVMLAIGSKSTEVATFASLFARIIAPFTPADVDVFNPNPYTQIALINYFHPVTPENIVSRAFLICLKMEEEITSQYALPMLRIAAHLLPVASLTCILENRPNFYVDSLLSLQISGEFRKKEVLLLHNHKGMTDILSAIPDKSCYIENFSEETFSVIMEEVKDKFDSVQVHDSSILLDQILALSAREG